MTERLKVIAGPMFSGKTDELIRLIERQEFAERRVQIFKPGIDTRWGEINKVKSHAGREKEAIPVEKAADILSLIKEGTEIVAIKVTAICTHSERFVSGNPANYNDPLVVIGAEEQYAPRCPNHHVVPGKPTRRIR